METLTAGTGVHHDQLRGRERIDEHERDPWPLGQRLSDRVGPQLQESPVKNMPSVLTLCCLPGPRVEDDVSDAIGSE
eukprot:2911021-Amphidinium_carterae.3